MKQKAYWDYSMIGDELTTTDVTTGNVVRFRRTTDTSLIEELEEQQRELESTLARTDHVKHS